MARGPVFIVALACGLVVLGCSYSFNVSRCSVRCTGGERCPDGFACLDDQFCHASATEEMCPCAPLRCAEISGSCGDMPDTCGGTVACGDCADPQTCGGSGNPNRCGDPASCQPQPCAPGACGSVVDTCGHPAMCPGCGTGEKCTSGHCAPCTPHCANGELACGDDGCDDSCGTCPDARWTCHPAGVCCIRSGQHCEPFTEGCNCCPGLFCVNGFCQAAAGCAMAPDRSPNAAEP